MTSQKVGVFESLHIQVALPWLVRQVTMLCCFEKGRTCQRTIRVGGCGTPTREEEVSDLKSTLRSACSVSDSPASLLRVYYFISKISNYQHFHHFC